MHPTPSYQVWEGHVLEPHHICLPRGRPALNVEPGQPCMPKGFSNMHTAHTPYTVKCTADSSMQTCSTTQLEVNWLLFAISTI